MASVEIPVETERAHHQVSLTHRSTNARLSPVNSAASRAAILAHSVVASMVTPRSASTQRIPTAFA